MAENENEIIDLTTPEAIQRSWSLQTKRKSDAKLSSPTVQLIPDSDIQITAVEDNASSSTSRPIRSKRAKQSAVPTLTPTTTTAKIHRARRTGTILNRAQGRAEPVDDVVFISSLDKPPTPSVRLLSTRSNNPEVELLEQRQSNPNSGLVFNGMQQFIVNPTTSGSGLLRLLDTLQQRNQNMFNMTRTAAINDTLREELRSLGGINPTYNPTTPPKLNPIRPPVNLAPPREEPPMNPAMLKCVICQTLAEADTQLVSTNCGHIFCEPCLQGSLQHNRKCPICRKNIPKKNGFHKLYL
ncbi:hypothetical protein BC833DRAFT_576370 [Globomyces pollinis-pini]|nr:hypothetical protein BC833DRAFT_576370 [Globomyces pollinis-pini]